MLTLAILVKRYSALIGGYFLFYYLYSGELYIDVFDVSIPIFLIIGLSFLNALGVPYLKKLATAE